ncbi:hypothetical protein L1987_18640 [Smallanthus sonchifolius]|uniref:Uncharacterized protein n=1 Tax=Smallanthus sonchifolius TaxID=185202 RepID=A0ACB9J2W5_9ASTR|nr:hypothetical protein L1987_18640 [Smallanthus sonchifolius]
METSPDVNLTEFGKKDDPTMELQKHKEEQDDDLEQEDELEQEDDSERRDCEKDDGIVNFAVIYIWGD